MTTTSILSLLLAIFKAIPTLKSWWDDLLVMYVTKAKNDITKDNVEAIKRALNEHDQRHIETQLGSETSGKPSGVEGTIIVNSLPGVKLLLIILLFAACVSKREINASIWLNNSPLPVELCEREVALKEYGFYRRLNNGNFEFISFCNKKSNKWLAIHKDDFNRLMNRVNEPSNSTRAIRILK